MGYYYSSRFGSSLRRNNVEIQGREIALSIVIFFILLTLGFFISDKISEKILEDNAEYSKALILENIKDYEYNKLIGTGNTFTYFEMKTIVPISLPELKGEYLAIEKRKERYTMHTRIVTYTDSKGNMHTRTETYWTWDYVSSQNFHHNLVLFNNEPLDISRFTKWPEYNLNLQGNVKEDTIRSLYRRYDRLHVYDKRDSNIRYYFRVIPLEFSGSVYIDLENNEIKTKQIELHTGKEPNDLYESFITSIVTAKVIFWITWILFTAGLIVGFIILENKWLKD